jgi:hypothetical protein
MVAEKLPALLAVVVPTVAEPSRMATVAPGVAVPLRVIEGLVVLNPEPGEVMAGAGRLTVRLVAVLADAAKLGSPV